MSARTIERIIFVLIIIFLIGRTPDCPPAPPDSVRIDTFYVDAPIKKDTGRAVRDTARYKKKNNPITPPAGNGGIAQESCQDTAEYSYSLKDSSIDLKVTARVSNNVIDTFYLSYFLRNMIISKEIIKYVPHYTPTKGLSLYPYVEVHLGVKNSYGAGAFYLRNRSAFGGGYNFTDKQVVVKYGYGIF